MKYPWTLARDLLDLSRREPLGPIKKLPCKGYYCTHHQPECQMQFTVEAHDQEHDSRLETGPVTPEDDWTGLFIRGDQCAGFALAVGRAIQEVDSSMLSSKLAGLKILLEKVDETSQHDFES